MYERHGDRVLPTRAFVWRIARHAGAAGLVVAGSLFAGMLGYVRLEGLTWLDGFLNAAMLLGGMGPVETPRTPGGKLFAGLYALYSGMVFLVVAGVLMAPVVHRVIHKFHWKEYEDDAEGRPPRRRR